MLRRLLFFVAIQLAFWFSCAQTDRGNNRGNNGASAATPNLRGNSRRLLDEGRNWKDRVKEKGEVVFQEKKRAAIRAACYKDWSVAAAGC